MAIVNADSYANIRTTSRLDPIEPYGEEEDGPHATKTSGGMRSRYNNAIRSPKKAIGAEEGPDGMNISVTHIEIKRTADIQTNNFLCAVLGIIEDFERSLTISAKG